jgi:hypothetical protein
VLLLKANYMPFNLKRLKRDKHGTQIDM